MFLRAGGTRCAKPPSRYHFLCSKKRGSRFLEQGMRQVTEASIFLLSDCPWGGKAGVLWETCRTRWSRGGLPYHKNLGGKR